MPAGYGTIYLNITPSVLRGHGEYDRPLLQFRKLPRRTISELMGTFPQALAGYRARLIHANLIWATRSSHSTCSGVLAAVHSSHDDTWIFVVDTGRCFIGRMLILIPKLVLLNKNPHEIIGISSGKDTVTCKLRDPRRGNCEARHP